jgi:UDP-perosamine 4-acetyltransferase
VQQKKQRHPHSSSDQHDLLLQEGSDQRLMQQSACATDIVIFGAGGHAKVVVDTCRTTGLWRPVACLGESRWSDLSGVPVEAEIGASGWLERGVSRCIIAIGNNRIREEVGEAAIGAGFQLVTIVSPFSYVSQTAVLGAGTVVMAGAVIQIEAVVGAMGIVNTGASIDHECRLGRAVHVAPHATLCGNVVAGDRAWIGAGATVIEGMQIADDVFVAAGAAIVCDVRSAGARVGGVPAKPLGKQ